MTTTHSIAQRIARAQRPAKPAWLLAFESTNAIAFTECADRSICGTHATWFAPVGEEHARIICKRFGVAFPERGNGVSLDGRFGLLRRQGWQEAVSYSVYVRDEDA